jgi:hypothetical protein
MVIPKLQVLEEEADDSPTAQAWDKSLPKKVLELAARMATVAQAHSEWHRRMTSENLNQANRSLVTLAGYCVHSTVVPAIVPKNVFAPSEEIHVKELLLSNGGGCYGKSEVRDFCRLKP